MIYNTTTPSPATQSFADWYQGYFNSPSEIIAHYWQAIEAAAESIGGTVTDNIITFDAKRKYIPNFLGKKDQRQYVISDLKTSKDGTVWPSITFGTFRNGGNTVYLNLRDIAFQEWKSGEAPQQQTGTRADFTEWKRKAEEDRELAEQARKAAQTAAAEHARSILGKASKAAQTAYTERKGLVSGHYLTNPAGDLLIRIQDETGQTVNIQRITPDGAKKFLSGGRVSGCFHVLHGKAPAILCEGYATGATIQAATGREVIIAFSANNLPKVARVLAGRVALLAADHDNSGTGEKYAKETGLPYLMPPTVGDWNDYAAQNGTEAVTQAFKEPAEDITPDSAKDALRAAFSLVARYSRKVPGEHSADYVINKITEKLSLGEDHQIRARSFLQSLVKRRRAVVSKAWKITDDKRIQCSDLPAYSSDWQHGVTFIRSPMASGKSARIGSPFITESMGRRYTVASTPSKALCHEQSAKFGIDLYSDVGRGGFASPAMSVCIPSLDKDALQEQIGGASAFLFDEWSQSLAMLASRGVCNEGDFDKLARICSTLDAGIFADAFLSDFDIQFVKSLIKPGLPVRIYDVADKALGFKARHTFGGKAREWIIQEALTELQKGGRCWISCEGRRSSQTIGEMLRADGFRVLIVNKLTRETLEVLDFLKDAETVSREYAAIIHSPTITSGLSIEHEGNPHFTRGFFLGGGWKLQPKTCAQMLRRVRYIQEWSIGFMPNNAAQTVTEAAELQARAEITNMTGQAIEGREAFIRDIERRDVNQRADFASGMLWLLEDMRFKLERVPCSVSAELAEQVSAKSSELDEITRAAIIAAPILTSDQAQALRASHEKTPSDHHTLTAADIRAAFGIETLTPEIVDFYDEGRGLHRLRLFADACGVAYQDNTLGKALNDSGAIRRGLYAYLFEGIDITGTITRQDAETIIGRVMARRFTLAAFGCVPGKWGRVVELDDKRRSRSREDKDGHICEIKRPAYPMQEVVEILSMMGLELEKGKREGKAGSKGRSKIVSPDRLALIQSLMGATCPHNILGTWGNVAPSEIPEAQPIFTPAKPEPSPANDTWQEEDESLFSPVERALRSEVRALLSRFNGLPSSTTGEVWLPLSDELGFQKTMTVPVPDCFQILAEEQVYPLPGEPSAFFAFPFDIDISEELLWAVRNTPAHKRAFILEHTDGLPYVVAVPAVRCDQSAIENTRKALRLAR